MATAPPPMVFLTNGAVLKVSESVQSNPDSEP